MDEIKIVYSDHKMTGVNDSEVRSYPETFLKELIKSTKSGYRKATITVGNNKYQLVLEEAGEFRQWISQAMYQDLLIANSCWQG